MRPVIGILRGMGLRLVVYLDNILPLYERVRRGVTKRRSCCSFSIPHTLGFIINFEKSVFQPQKVLKYLGMLVNTESLSLALTADKNGKLTALCLSLLRRESPPLRDVATLLGHFSWAIAAVQYSQVSCRGLQHFLNLHSSLGSLESKFNQTPEAIADFKWFKWSSKHFRILKDVSSLPIRIL